MQFTTQAHTTQAHKARNTSKNVRDTVSDAHYNYLFNLSKTPFMISQTLIGFHRAFANTHCDPRVKTANQWSERRHNIKCDEKRLLNRKNYRTFLKYDKCSTLVLDATGQPPKFTEPENGRKNSKSNLTNRKPILSNSQCTRFL